ncbi:MAG: MarC family protein [Puniceicoccales bacterium]|jgi:multiple antibiotic resistance protein|nr:MarC family protein [Puniceicoccales bacterium]
MVGHTQYLIQYFSRLFIISCPLAIVALFVSMTAPYTLAERVRTAKVGVSVAYGTTLFFSMVGGKFFEFLGITMGSFYITGGVILAMLGVSMLNSNDMDRDDDNNAGVKEVTKKNKADISVTPLGIPIICGPACITATIALQGEAEGFVQNIVGFVAITLVFGVLYLMLVSSAKGTKWLTPMVLKLSFKLSGLIIAALGVQMIFSGLRHGDLRALKPLRGCDANITGNTLCIREWRKNVEIKS